MDGRRGGERGNENPSEKRTEKGKASRWKIVGGNIDNAVLETEKAENHTSLHNAEKRQREREGERERD